MRDKKQRRWLEWGSDVDWYHHKHRNYSQGPLGEEEEEEEENVGG